MKRFFYFFVTLSLSIIKVESFAQDQVSLLPPNFSMCFIKAGQIIGGSPYKVYAICDDDKKFVLTQTDHTHDINRRSTLTRELIQVLGELKSDGWKISNCQEMKDLSVIYSCFVQK